MHQGSLEAAEKSFSNTACSEVANISRKNPFYQIQNTDSLKSCIGKMVALSNIHRLPVFDLQGNFCGVLSQSQVIGVISENLSVFSMITNKTVADLRLGIKKVVSVNITDPIQTAFKLVSEHVISGVAVVDEKSGLRGNVSASDIKIIDSKNGGNFNKLLSPIGDVLGETMAKTKPLSVTPSSTIAEVFKLMSNEKVHRVFVVSELTNEVVGVISLVDLLDLVGTYV